MPMLHVVLHVHLTTSIIGLLNKEKCPNYLCAYKRERGGIAMIQLSTVVSPKVCEVK